MGDFEVLLQKFMSREQVKYLINQMVEKAMLEKEGRLKGTTYKHGKKMEEGAKLVARAMHLGIEEMKKRGEIPNA